MVLLQGEVRLHGLGQELFVLLSAICNWKLHSSSEAVKDAENQVPTKPGNPLSFLRVIPVGSLSKSFTRKKVWIRLLVGLGVSPGMPQVWGENGHWVRTVGAVGGSRVDFGDRIGL